MNEARAPRYTQEELNEAVQLAIDRTLQNVREGRLPVDARAPIEPLEQLIAKWREGVDVNLQNAGRQRRAGFPELADESLVRAEVVRGCLDDLEAALRAVPAQKDGEGSTVPIGYHQLCVEHARKQGAADGFQQGWHGALTRIREGDSVDTLSELVPPGPAQKDAPEPETEKRKS